MGSFFRRDDDVQNGLGEAMPNIAVTYYAQPSMALAAIFADPDGVTPAGNPQFTNGLGQTAAYMAAGLYTIVYSGAQIQTITYPDQLVGPGSGSGGTLTRVIPTPAADGSTRIFTISIPSINPVNDQFFVAGSYVEEGVAYTVSGNTITWISAVPPQTGDSLVYYVS
jgi:hypothetical protein